MNYLLIGEEEYLKHRFLEKLRKSVLNSSSSQLDFEIFRGDENLTAILDSCNTLPFLSEKKLIIIKDFDKFSPREKDSILKYLKSPRDSTTLLLESLASKLNDKSLKEISKFVKVIKCNRLREGELSLWIRKEFAIRKKKISQPGADLIKEVVGEDLFLLKNEIEKILSFVGDRDEIAERDIEIALGRGASKTAFELVDLVLEKRIDKLFASMDNLLTKEKPHQILNLLAWQFRNFIKIKSMPQGLSIEEIAGKINISWYFAKKFMEQSRRFIQSDLEKNLAIILETDFFIKTGKIDARHALERALVGLCR